MGRQPWGEWRARRDSNPRPSGPQPDALSTELRAHDAAAEILAEREGFEPSKQVTPLGGLANRCTRPLCDLSVRAAGGILPSRPGDHGGSELTWSGARGYRPRADGALLLLSKPGMMAPGS